MRIEQDIKLDYKDVLFKPKRSTLESRREVRLERNKQERSDLLQARMIALKEKMAKELLFMPLINQIKNQPKKNKWRQWGFMK